MLYKKFKDVCFVDDITRNSFWPAKEFFYDLMTPYLEIVLKRDIAPSVRRTLHKEGIINLHLAPDAKDDWVPQQYEHFDPATMEALQRFANPATLYFCYEASPALLIFFESNNLTYIDIRISPIRFLPDVVLALRSNLKQINNEIAKNCIRHDEIKVQSGRLIASYRHQERYRKPVTGGEGELFFVGQTAADMSIVKEGKFFRIADAHEQIKAWVGSRPLNYLAHPSASVEHVEYEMEELSKITTVTKQRGKNSYDLLCRESDDAFIGLSSGLLQEAEFFKKKATAILPYICPLKYQKSEPGNGFYQLVLDDFLNVDFFSRVLGVRNVNQQWRILPFRDNLLRNLHNVWWGYAGHMARTTEWTRASQREVTYRIDNVQRVLGAISDSVSRYLIDEAIFHQGWQWPGGARIDFTRQNKVLRNGQEAGFWMAIADNKFLIVWTGMFWSDEALYWEGRLQCENNAGRRFEVSPTVE